MKTIALPLMIGAATGAHVGFPQSPGVASALTPAAHAAPVITTVAAAGLTDGTYTGPSIDAYYGLVQVQAVVQNGQITSLKMLRYPSDRRESLIISQQALPLLRNEVVSAQSARVNIISGATLTSQAFIQSLGGALTQAGAPPVNPPSQSAPRSFGGGNRIGI
jgi:uncharacterized protein with FMN-binding domain